MSNEALYNAAAAIGIILPTTLIPDGRIHRCGHKNSSWYVIWLEPVKTIVFGDWKLGITDKYIDSDKTTNQDNRRINAQIKEAVRLREKEIEQAHIEAASIATARWNNAKPAVNHPYLERKQVDPYRLRVDGELLLVPVTDGEGIHSLQTINSDGDKWFLPGGKVQGHFYPIGLEGTPKDLFICEGIATALTIYQLHKTPVIVAFNAKNLIPVAELMRWRYPDAGIVIAGDNDHSTPGNPGKAAAELAAIRSNSSWIVPDFTGLPFAEKDTDYNDLAILRGEL